MSEENDDIFDEMEKMFQSLFDEAESLFAPESRCLRPLHRVSVTDDTVIVSFDLPCVESKEHIQLTATEQTLNIEAKMRKPVKLRVGGSFQRHMEFERYSKKIRLPTKVNPNHAKATFRNGVLTIRFPLEHRGSGISIG